MVFFNILCVVGITTNSIEICITNFRFLGMYFLFFFFKKFYNSMYILKIIPGWGGKVLS